MPGEESSGPGGHNKGMYKWPMPIILFQGDMKNVKAQAAEQCLTK